VNQQSTSDGQTHVPAWDEQSFTLAEYPEKLAIVKLGPGAEVPRWAESSSIFSVTATATETSVICASRSVPTKTPCIRPLTAFRVASEIEPTQVGVLASLLPPLAAAGLPAYPFSTFETDWVLVRFSDREAAAAAWRSSGHTVTVAIPVEAKKAQARNAPAKKAPTKKASRT
jgi:hypothetical protein